MPKFMLAVMVFMAVWVLSMCALESLSASLSAQAIDPMPTMMSTSQVMPTATLQPSPTLQPWPRLYSVYLPLIGGAG